MTQFSWPWACDATGDGGAASYTLDVVEVTNRIMTNLNPTSDGVIYWTDTTVLPFTGFTNASTGLLAPTNPSGNTIRIASGLGLAKGWLYANDDNVDFDATGAANATDIIVLRKDRTAQTVRLALVQAGAGGTATVTQNTTTWEVLIATIALDGSGNVSTLTDSRVLARPPVGSWTPIETITSDGTLNNMVFDNIPPIFTHLKIEGVAGSTASATQSDLRFYLNSGSGSTQYNEGRMEIKNSTITHVATKAPLSYFTIGEVTGATGGVSSSGNLDAFTIEIPNYSKNVSIRNIMANVTCYADGSVANGLIRFIHTGFYDPAGLTKIVSQMVLDIPSANFADGTEVTLYGIVA